MQRGLHLFFPHASQYPLQVLAHLQGYLGEIANDDEIAFPSVGTYCAGIALLFKLVIEGHFSADRQTVARPSKKTIWMQVHIFIF